MQHPLQIKKSFEIKRKERIKEEEEIKRISRSLIILSFP